MATARGRDGPRSLKVSPSPSVPGRRPVAGSPVPARPRLRSPGAQQSPSSNASAVRMMIKVVSQVLSPKGDDEVIHPDHPIRTSRVVPHDDLVSGEVDHHARRTCFVGPACPQTWTPLDSPFAQIYSNACSSRNLSSGGARFPGANGPTTPRGCVGRTTSSNCSGGRYERSVPDHRFEQAAISPAATSEPSTEASARPMPSSARRVSRYVPSGRYTAGRAPADSTAAQSPA